MTSRAPAAVGDGRYRLERRLGSGGMASVWAARDERLDRHVAIKLLADGLADDPAWTERFRREARVAASVTHPGVVRIFDAGVEDGRPYLVMAHLEGRDLGRILRDPEATPPDAHGLATDLLAALGAVHAAGIVHRDVKAGNVLIDPDGRARLIDFGIARPDDATGLTSVGLVIGTPRYMAPEVAEGHPATVASDLYATGVLLRDVAGPDGPAAVRALADALTRSAPEDRPASAAAALALLAPAPTDRTARHDAASGREDAPTRVHGHAPTRVLGHPPTRVRAPRPRAAGGPSRGTAPADGSDGPRRGRRRAGRLVAAGVAVLAVGAVGVGIAAAGDDRPAAPVPRAAPADAPLGEQLDALRRGVDAAAAP